MRKFLFAMTISLLMFTLFIHNFSIIYSQTSTSNFGAMKMQSKISGEGTPLLLVPGGLTGWVSWEPHTKVLSKNRTVIRVQLLNVQYGLEKRALPDDYTMNTECEALAATLDSLSYTAPIDIVGWSYGAFTSLQFALDHPERIRTLTLIEPPAMWVLRKDGKLDESAQSAADFFLTFDRDVTEDMLAAFLIHAGFIRPGESSRHHPLWDYWFPFRQSLRTNPAVVNFNDDLKRVQNFRAPVLLVKGTESSPWLHKVIDRLSENFPNSRVVEYNGAHAPHIVSMDEFLSEIEKFHRDAGK